MMMEQFMYWEIRYLFLAVLFGAGIGFVYDGLRIFRNVLPHASFFVSVEDLLFWIVCTYYIFYLQYRLNNGVTRWFSIVGILVGMLGYSHVLGKTYVAVMSKILNRVKSLLTYPLKASKIILCKQKMHLRKSEVNNGKAKDYDTEEATEQSSHGIGNDSGSDASGGGTLQQYSDEGTAGSV